MKKTLIGLSLQYAAALRKHLRPGARASLRAALDLGCQGAALELEILDMARMHDAALATLASSRQPTGATKRAEMFFAEAISPIEETHRTARQASARLNSLNQRLGLCSTDLADSCLTLKQSVVQRKILQDSGEKSRKLLKESRRFQKHLRHLTHQMLSAQEDQRKEISHELQDKIAQTLLGINVRLVTLKKEAAANAHGFEEKIAGTARLVNQSVKSMTRFAREIGIPHRTQPI